MVTEVEILLGDITALEVEAVVNAANRTLCGGGCCDPSSGWEKAPEVLQRSGWCANRGGEDQPWL